MRTTNAVPRKRRKNRLFQKTKGYVGARRHLIRTAKENIVRAEAFAFRDRRARKREFRKLWIIRSNAAVRVRGLSYSEFIYGLKKANIGLDHKSLSETAIHDPAGLDTFAKAVRRALAAGGALGGVGRVARPAEGKWPCGGGVRGGVGAGRRLDASGAWM